MSPLEPLRFKDIRLAKFAMRVLYTNHDGKGKFKRWFVAAFLNELRDMPVDCDIDGLPLRSDINAPTIDDKYVQVFAPKFRVFLYNGVTSFGSMVYQDPSAVKHYLIGIPDSLQMRTRVLRDIEQRFIQPNKSVTLYQLVTQMDGGLLSWGVPKMFSDEWGHIQAEESVSATYYNLQVVFGKALDKN